MDTKILTVIKNRYFTFLWSAQAISQISLNMLSFILAIQVYQYTSSNTAVSLMLITFALPSVIFGIVFGGIVDNLDKRKVLVFCNLSRALVLIGFFWFFNNLPFLFLLTAIISLLTQLFIPAEGPSIPQLVKKEELLAANSLFSITFYLSMVIGSVFAGPMIRWFGQSQVYIVMSFFLVFAAFLTYQLPQLKSTQVLANGMQAVKETMKLIGEGFSFINQNIRIKQSLYLLTFSQALISTLAILAPGFADKVLTIELTDASVIVMGPAALGLIVGAFLIGMYGNKFLKGTLILIGIILSGTTLLILSVVSLLNGEVIPLVMMLLFILGFCNSLINIPTSTILQQETKENLRGRIYGVLTALIGGVSILPVIFSGILADNVGIIRTLLIIGFFVLVIGIYYLYKRHKVFEHLSI